MPPLTSRRRGLAAQVIVVTSAGWSAAQPGPTPPAPGSTGQPVPVAIRVQQPSPGTGGQSGAAPGSQPAPGAGSQPSPGTGSTGAGPSLPSGGSQAPSAPNLPSGGSQAPSAPNLPSGGSQASAAAQGGGASIQQAGGQGSGAAEAGGGTAAAAAPAGSSTSTSLVSGGGGAAGASQNAQTAADLLSRSTASTGVEVQQRNSVVADPRVRGLQSRQYTTTADGGLYLPARLDLDTPLSRFDPGSVRQIAAVKGPYSAVLGPGLAHLDLTTLGSPRYQDGFQWHGRTAAGYQTNGNRWDLLQSVNAGDPMFGFRLTHNTLTGNDYRAGDGTRVPASFTSNITNFAVGLNLTDKSALELRGLHAIQNNLEFPGLYFDIRQSQTDAYTLRYTLDDQGLFDRLALDVWYNSTAATGDTRSGNKQAFVQKLLGVSFNPVFGVTPGTVDPAVRTGGLAGSRLPTLGEQTLLNQAGPLNLFRDDSTTRFAVRSVGYRLATSWGPDKDDPYLTVGTSLNAFGQGLAENIRITQLTNASIGNGLPIGAGGQSSLNQFQSIPESNQVIPGLFLQARAPLTARWTVRSGGRVDWVHSSSNRRLIQGDFNLFGPAANFNTLNPPVGPTTQGTLVPGVPAVGPLNTDPLVYSADPSNPDLTRTDLLLAGFLSSEYKLDDHWTASVAFGHAQRAPTLTELYAAGPFVGVLQQGTSRLIGDPALRSEHLTQLDIGLRAEYDYLTVGANAFYGWIDNYITFDANRLSPGLTQVVFTNTDLATLAGAELFAQADVTDWLTPFATLSYVQGVDQTARDRRRAGTLDSSRREDPLTLRRRAETEPLPQIPPLESRVGFRVHAPGRNPRWQVEFNARVVDDQTLIAASLDERRTGGFTVFNIRGFVRLTDNLLVSAGVDNLADRTYREHLDPISGNLLGVGPLLRPGTNFFFNTQITY